MRSRGEIRKIRNFPLQKYNDKHSWRKEIGIREEQDRTGKKMYNNVNCT